MSIIGPKLDFDLQTDFTGVPEMPSSATSMKTGGMFNQFSNYAEKIADTIQASTQQKEPPKTHEPSGGYTREYGAVQIKDSVTGEVRIVQPKTEREKAKEIVTAQQSKSKWTESDFKKYMQNHLIVYPTSDPRKVSGETASKVINTHNQRRGSRGLKGKTLEEYREYVSTFKWPPEKSTAPELPPGVWFESDFKKYFDWYTATKSDNNFLKAKGDRLKVITDYLNKIRNAHMLGNLSTEEFRLIQKGEPLKVTSSITGQTDIVPGKTFLEKLVDFLKSEWP